MRPLNNFDVYFVIGLHIENACHEDLAQVICLEGLEISIEFRRHVSTSLLWDEKVLRLSAGSSPLVLVDNVTLIFPYGFDGIGTTLSQAGMCWTVNGEL